eukprot:8012337-Karenia_brevis.AAC.1
MIQDPQITNVSSSHDPQDKTFVCTALTQGGQTCGKTFRTFKQLLTHARRSSKNGHVEYHAKSVGHLVISNQCVFCESRFKSKEAAVQHVKSSIIYNRCKANQAYFPMPLQVPKTITCAFCQKHFEDIGSYNSHVVQHFGIRPQIVPKKEKKIELSSSLSLPHHSCVLGGTGLAAKANSKKRRLFRPKRGALRASGVKKDA